MRTNTLDFCFPAGSFISCNKVNSEICFTKTTTQTFGHMTSAIMSGSTEHLSMPQKDSQTPCLIEMARGSDRKEAKAVPWFEAVSPLPKHMGVSKNRGTPKSSILIGFSTRNHPFWGTPIFGTPKYHLQSFLPPEGKLNFARVLIHPLERVCISFPVETTINPNELYFKACMECEEGIRVGDLPMVQYGIA